MANPNAMPEFHSVKAYLAESLTENIPAPLIKQPASACTINANSTTPLTHKGGRYHV